MELSLNLNQEVVFILFEKINEVNICNDIVLLKNKMEKEEAYEYHFERWETIASKYFSAIDKSRRIMDYHYYKDYELDFYNETGFSYKVKDMINRIICCRDRYGRECYDLKYSIIAKKRIEQLKIKNNI